MEDTNNSYANGSTILRGTVYPALVATIALAIALVGAFLVRGSADIDGVNFFVESLSGNSTSFFGGLGIIAPLGFAFGAGVAAAFNPCGFAMLPAYMGLYMGADSSTASTSIEGISFSRIFSWSLAKLPKLLALTAGVLIGSLFLNFVFPKLPLPFLISFTAVIWILILYSVARALIGLIRQRRLVATFRDLAGQLAKALVIGGSVTAGFVLLFAVAGAVIGLGARSVVGSILPWLGLSIGVLLTLAGAWLLSGGKLYTALAQRISNRMGDPGQANIKGYFLFGLSYGTASLSCTLPIFLAVVGTTFAVSSIATSFAQFVLYALGMGMVIIVLTLGMALFKGTMVSGMRKAMPYIQPVGTWLMIIAGTYIVFYWLTIGGLLDGFA